MALIPGAFTAPGKDGRVGRTGFCIDRYEYPNRKGAEPLRRVNWEKAQKLCGKQGKRLCTVPEWERACRGPYGHPFPYGTKYDPEACRTDLGWGGEPAAGGASRGCMSGYGVWDMVGNLWEWTEDERPGEEGQKILKGGSWASRGERFASCAAEISNYSGIKLGYYGFRCCLEHSIEESGAYPKRD
jgi:formylglycine-generating enzyme required for sulfatase activity